jgi:isopentenyldiphosphate isomerase
VADLELLDVFDEQGARLGVRTRADVHREGLWHRCLHLWVVTDAGEVLLQRRGRGKAAWPGMLDATAAGHLTAGETVLDGLREAEEELGIVFSPAQVRPLGVRAVADRPVPGTLNREVQHVYAARSPLSLEDWTGLDRTEVDGLVALPIAAFAALVHDGIPQPAREWDGERVTRPEVAPGELVPSPYLAVLAIMLERFAAGLEPLAL